MRSEGEKVEVLMSEKPKTYCLEDGKFWRVSVFINDAYTYETVNPEYSEYAGEAFGNFEAMYVFFLALIVFLLKTSFSP